jgi:hypothetical protein
MNKIKVCLLAIRQFRLVKLGALLICAVAANAQEENMNSLYIFDSRIEFKLSPGATGKKDSHQSTRLDCSNWLSSWLFGKICKIYIGDLPIRSGVFEKKQTRPEFLTLKKLNKRIQALDEIRQTIVADSGISEYELPIRIEKNRNGVELGYGGFQFPGTDAVAYIVILGASPILISGAQWIDSESIYALK